MTPQQLKAMKLALEALLHAYHEDSAHPKTLETITAIKEALAQEQDGQCKRCTDGCPACDARKLQKEEHDLLCWSWVAKL